jgi:hypothetical protein
MILILRMRMRKRMRLRKMRKRMRLRKMRKMRKREMDVQKVLQDNPLLEFCGKQYQKHQTLKEQCPS